MAVSKHKIAPHLWLDNNKHKHRVYFSKHTSQLRTRNSIGMFLTVYQLIGNGNSRNFL